MPLLFCYMEGAKIRKRKKVKEKMRKHEKNCYHSQKESYTNK